MFPKKYRLVLSSTAPRKRFADRFSNQYFTLLRSPNTLGHLRFASVVGKKIYKQAYSRNHLRRQLAEIVKNAVPKTLSQDILVIPTQNIQGLPYSQIRDHLIPLLDGVV